MKEYKDHSLAFRFVLVMLMFLNTKQP